MMTADEGEGSEKGRLGHQLRNVDDGELTSQDFHTDGGSPTSTSK
jgi:hypothetical protein